MEECVSCTQFAAVIPRFSAGISSLSSSLIIYIIYRSFPKLKTVYHRIMLGMSISDILGSIAVGLTTLAMPKELPFDPPFFEGTRLGNSETCKSQGFFFTFGFVAMFSYNGTLFLYNTCSIVFQMQEKKIVKYVEPVIHLVPLSAGLAVAVPFLSQNQYLATPWTAWCNVAVDVDYMVMAFFLLFIVGVIIQIALIIWKVMNLEKTMIPVHTNSQQEDSQSSGLQRVSRSFQNTKIIGIQAFAYFSSFMITAGIFFLQSLMDDKSHWLTYLSLVCMPLQGFFNLLIFVFHKIYNYRRVNSDATNFDVIMLLLRGNAEEPILFSRISLIEMHHQEQQPEFVEISDEYKSELVHLKKMSGRGVEIDDKSNYRDDVFEGFELPVVPQSNDEDTSLNKSVDDSRAGLSGFSSKLSPPDSEIRAEDQIISSRDLFSNALGVEDGVSIDRSSSIRGWLSKSEEKTTN